MKHRENNFRHNVKNALCRYLPRETYRYSLKKENAGYVCSWPSERNDIARYSKNR